jgi:Ca2+-binding EF-hand superfamily protein
LNENGYIDVEDLLLILSEFGCLSDCNYDVSGDGHVSVADILIILSNFGVACD